MKDVYSKEEVDDMTYTKTEVNIKIAEAVARVSLRCDKGIDNVLGLWRAHITADRETATTGIREAQAATPDSVEKIAASMEDCQYNLNTYRSVYVARLRALKADRNPTDKKPAEKHKIEIVGTLPIGWKEIRFDGGVHHWFCTEGHLFAMKSLALALGIEIVEKP